MQNVGIALEGMGERLTGNAVPILQQLQLVLERATSKLEKYSNRNKAQVACYAYSEAVRLPSPLGSTLAWACTTDLQQRCHLSRQT